MSGAGLAAAPRDGPTARPVAANLVAAAVGNAGAAIVQIVFVPVYIAMLGVEAYGLIALHAVLQVSLWLLDLGFTPAMSREVSRALAGARDVAAVRNLLRSMEAAFAGIGVVLALAALAAAPWIASNWLRLGELPIPSAERAFALGGAIVALRLFIGLHRGALSGAQRLAWVHLAGFGFAVARAVGVIAVLGFFPSVEAFFAFQLAVTLAEAVVMRRRAWAEMPGAAAPVASLAALREVSRFSGGMTAVAALLIVLTQSDKALLSTLLPLADFATYALASSVAGAVALLHGAVSATAYPRLNELSARGDRAAFAASFQGFAQLVALAVAPAAAVLACEAAGVLSLWTRDPWLAARASPLLELLAAGAMLMGFTAMPYLLPMVAGRLRPLLLTYAALAVLYVPSIYWGVGASGAIAAAWASVGVNACGVAFGAALVAAELGARACASWLATGVLLPLAAALIAARSTGAALGGGDASDAWTFAQVACAYAAALLACAAVLPRVRRYLFDSVTTLRNWRQ